MPIYITGDAELLVTQNAGVAVTADALLMADRDEGRVATTGDALLLVSEDEGRIAVTADVLMVVTLETPPVETPALADAGGQHYPDDGWAAAADLGLA